VPVHHALWVAAASRQETQNEWSMLYTDVLLAADQDRAMAKTFKVGDHVSWNSEAGRVRGKIVKVHKRAVNYKGYIHRATPDDPQYEIKSDKTDHVALHKAGVLRRLG
jgi:Hypervirulence associated proteins TUDOR domain